MAFEFNFVEHSSVRIISFKGSLLTEADLEKLNELINDNKNQFIFDLSELNHVNSSGIGFFIKTLTRSRIAGGELLITGLNGNVLKLFNISKIDRLFTIVPTVEEGINFFKN